MSEKTFIGKILAEILEFFKANWFTFAKKTWKKVPEELKEKVSIGVMIVENIKKIIDSPVVDLITNLIPGELDDKVKDYLRKILPVILESYTELNYSEKYSNMNNYTLPDEIKSKTLHNIATDITHSLTDMSYGQSALTTEVCYQCIIKNA
jgi:hypothetical protein